MAEQFGDKTQEATPYRRQKAREEGQVARSQDLSSAMLLVGATVTLMYFGRAVMRFLGLLACQQLGGDAWLQVDPQFVTYQWNSTLFGLAAVLLPIFGLLLLLAIIVHLVQVGPMFLPQKLAPDPSRINPLKGFERLVSLSNVVRLGFGLFKIGVVLTVAFWCVQDYRGIILNLPTREVSDIGSLLFEILTTTCLKVGIALLILAILDYGFQKWKFEQDLRMTTQEVREEMKMLQGDPQMAARRRQIQRQLVLNRLQTSVPHADVVVTNPTHTWPSLSNTTRRPWQHRSSWQKGPACWPIGSVALHWSTISRSSSDKPLAQALYKHVDVNKPIPAQQYAAVAEILRYVYQLQGRSLPGQNAA